MKTLFYLLTAISLSFTARAQSAQSKNVDAKSLLNVEVYDLTGKHVRLAGLARHKVLFIDNWFIPCPPCFLEMKLLHTLYDEYARNPNVCFITISRTDSSVVRKFIAGDASLKKYTDSYHYLSQLDYFKLPVYFLPGCNAKVELSGKILHGLDPDNPSACADHVFGFSGYPTVMIFDKKGKLVFKNTGYDGLEDKNKVQLESAINAALKAD